MLAVCGGWGSGVGALLVTVLAIAAWAFVTTRVITTAPERRERKVLIAVTLISSLVGPAILFGLLAGFSGDNSRLPEIILVLLLPALVAACVTVGIRAARPARAFFLALWGAVLFAGGCVVLVASLLAFGGYCPS